MRGETFCAKEKRVSVDFALNLKTCWGERASAETRTLGPMRDHDEGEVTTNPYGFATVKEG